MMFALSIAAGAELLAEELPGVGTDAVLAHKLARALHAKGPSYQARTAHLGAAGTPRYTNRLLLEDAPYLIQHAHNPVNWFPWGREAFAQAKAEDKPIFLSIGYATCHWCHVMAQESFDNVAIARVLNENFIAIKVDRERRPAVDNVYMTAARLMMESTGWPLSSFLTVNGNTFWAGTYFPPEQFSQLLKEISQSWRERRDDIERQAQRIATSVEELTRNKRATRRIDEATLENALAALRHARDPQYGGLGRGPKFPRASTYLFLIDHALRANDSAISSWIKFDLDAIANGGIHDLLGGGFHRYSVDRRWHIPHFEKMLYTQAQLLRVYLHAYQLLGEARYATVVARIVAFLDREMRHPEGGYFAALDADSPGGEGQYYLWTRTEIEKLLTPNLSALAIDWYQLSERGNFDGANVLHVSQNARVFAAKHGLSATQWGVYRTQIEQTLLARRAQRPRPARDEKIVTAWNAMLITALAEASLILEEPTYLTRAIACANFLLHAHRTEKNLLWRSTFQGHGGVNAVASDYAALIESLIALYDATRNSQWLTRATELQHILDENYWDAKSGAYFMSMAKRDVPLMARPKSLEDSAVPAGNAMALTALVGLNNRSADLAFEKRIDELLAAIAGDLRARPTAHTYALRGHEIFRRGDNGPIRYAARGAVRITTRQQRDRIAIELKIKPGWHIQAHEPLQEDLIGTSLSIAAPSAQGPSLQIIYPPAVIKNLSFREHRLALYEDEVVITAKGSRGAQQSTKILPLQLSLQACNNRVCLPPERVALNTPTTHR